MKEKIILFDIDGCILDPVDRIDYLIKYDDQETYEDLWERDIPMPAGIAVYKALMDAKAGRPVFNTARRERQRESTTTQLQRLFPGHEWELWMRPNNTSSKTLPAWKLKTQQLFEIHKYSPMDVLIAFDDEDRVIQAYRAAGIVAYQTATYRE